VALRILVVEDDKHIRKILESLLTHEPSMKARSPEVIAAADGELGLKALEKGPFDLIITDLLMPHMDGFQFCRELRKHKFGATVPVIVTSAIFKDQAAQIRLKQEVGEHQFFAKPYEIRDLVKAVNKILDGGKAPRKDPTPAVGVPIVSDRPEMGTLGERVPARILLDFWERKLTGTLTITRGKVKKDVGLQSGILVNCDSNLRTETLGHFLVSRGAIDEKMHQAALTRAQSKKGLLGQSLIELGFITEKDLLHQLAAQMRAKIAAMLRWNEGNWSFAPGQPPSTLLQTPIEAPLLVFLGLQKTAHIDEIALKLASRRGRVKLTPRAERHRESFKRVFGPLALDALARQPLIEDLMSGTDPGQMLTHLDALLLCELAEIDATGLPQRAPNEATDPLALDRITQPATQAHAPEKNLYDQLFGEEPSEVKAIPSLRRVRRRRRCARRSSASTSRCPRAIITRSWAFRGTRRSR
jgi:CheY-like chemotaxis protein